MRIGKYGNLVSFLGRRNYFLSSRNILIRKFEHELTASLALQREIEILLSLTSSFFPKPIEAGLDDASGILYYSMNIPESLHPLQFESSNPETTELFANLVRALGKLHDARVSYRNVKPDAAALTQMNQPFYFDFSLAVPFLESRMVRTLGRRGIYDAPECVEMEYDGVRADIYGLGTLAKKQLPHPTSQKLRQVIEWMTAVEPRDRPSSMD